MAGYRTRKLLEQQIAYYRARANEYDRWFLRQGRYDRGPELNELWFSEVREVVGVLRSFAPRGRVLELACGTGLWTQHLAQFARSVTVVDASPEVLAIARQRLGEYKIHYVLADIFSWRPETLYDVVFFAFWLSHVPRERFASFWGLVKSCLAPNARMFFVDSLYSESSTAIDHRLKGPRATTVKRRLDDGREFEIVKVFRPPDELAHQVEEFGWQVSVRATANYFLYGFGMARQ